jgi:hypothetical protein
MNEIDNIKRLAGILKEYDEYEDDTGAAEQIANTYINGNISDAFQAVQGNISLFAEVALYLSRTSPNELGHFLQMAVQRG